MCMSTHQMMNTQKLFMKRMAIKAIHRVVKVAIKVNGEMRHLIHPPQKNKLQKRRWDLKMNGKPHTVNEGRKVKLHEQIEGYCNQSQFCRKKERAN